MLSRCFTHYWLSTESHVDDGDYCPLCLFLRPYLANRILKLLFVYDGERILCGCDGLLYITTRISITCVVFFYFCTSHRINSTSSVLVVDQRSTTKGLIITSSRSVPVTFSKLVAVDRRSAYKNLITTRGRSM